MKYNPKSGDTPNVQVVRMLRWFIKMSEGKMSKIKNVRWVNVFEIKNVQSNNVECEFQIRSYDFKMSVRNKNYERF